MKRVGVITMPRVINYGAILQAYGLCKTVADMGHECELIDYTYPNAFHLASKFQSRAILKRRLRSLLKRVCFTSELDKVRVRRFEAFLEGNMVFTDKTFRSVDELKSAPPVFDAYITGSDQVWNPKFVLDDPSFFLQFAPRNAARIAYAASIALTEIPEKFHAQYRKHIMEIGSLSLREDSGVRLVKKLTDRDSDLVLDPSLLLDKNEWSEVAVPFGERNPYIVCYCLGGFQYARRLCQHIAKMTGYSVVHVWPQPYERLTSSMQCIYDAGPAEFLGIFKGASFVVTNSFHGTAFAANFSKPFFTILRHDIAFDSRQASFLRMLGAESRGLELGAPLPSEEQLNMEFGSVQSVLGKKRKESIAFLHDALDG